MRAPPSRSNNGKGGSVATRIIRETLRQGGKIDEDVFRKIVRAKLSEKMANSSMANQPNMFSSGNKVKRSEKAQKSIDMMKAVNEEKQKRKERKEVIVIARRYINGKIDSKGNITDLTGNPVGKVNRKDGSITAANGHYFGKYRSKSGSVDSIIINMIDKHSPYLNEQRRLQILQKQAAEKAVIEQEYIERNQGSAHLLDVWGNQSFSSTLGDVWGNRRTDIWGNPV